jgi:hypothetical protein
MTHHATALIAEDEALLAQTLQQELHALWPNLQVLATAGDGLSAACLVKVVSKRLQPWPTSGRSTKPFRCWFL